MAEELTASKRGIKLLGKKKTEGLSSSPEGRPRGRLGKKPSSADVGGSSPAKGGKGIESIQKLVSKNKRRFVDKQHGFNLDLSYIGDRIIAMGFPSEGKEAAYRNPMSEVVRFLDTFHKDHYKVYNLCSERSYDPACFYGRVARYPFDDHNCPPMSLIYDCCRDIEEWMQEDPKNIAAIHCKAGKGRTGLIIGCWLQWNREWPDAAAALAFYAAARTHNQKGVTIPSQLRYVHYFGKALARPGGRKNPPPAKTVMLRELIFHDFVSPGELKFTISSLTLTGEQTVLRTWKDAGATLSAGSSKKDSTDLCFAIHPPLPLAGDVLVSVAGKPVFFHFWLSTAMLEGKWLTLTKSELDKANKDKKKVFPPDFRVKLIYSEEAQVVESLMSQEDKEVHPRRKLEYRFPTLMNL